MFRSIFEIYIKICINMKRKLKVVYAKTNLPDDFPILMMLYLVTFNDIIVDHFKEGLLGVPEEDSDMRRCFKPESRLIIKYIDAPFLLLPGNRYQPNYMEN